MTSPALWTLMGILAVSATVDPPTVDPAYEEAISYFKQDPSQRTRTQALVLLEKAFATTKDDRLRREIFLDEARLYSQSYDHNREKADLPRAIDCYVLAITVKEFSYSLDGLRARDELGAILLMEKRNAEAYVVFTEVVEANFERVCKDEIKPSFLAQLTEIDPFEESRGMKKSTPAYEAMVKQRMGIARGNVLYYYKDIRETSLRELIKIVQIDSGYAGLQELAEKYTDRRAQEQIQKAMKAATQDVPPPSPAP